MSPEQFLQVADLLPEALLLVRGNGTVLNANRAAAPCWACPRGELADQPLARLVDSPPDSLADYLRSCSRTSRWSWEP